MDGGLILRNETDPGSEAAFWFAQPEPIEYNGGRLLMTRADGRRAPRIGKDTIRIGPRQGFTTSTQVSSLSNIAGEVQSLRSGDLRRSMRVRRSDK